MNEKTILDVNAMRAGLAEMLPGVDVRFTIFYDETNNIRKLYLTDDGFNVAKHENFVLGGIALREGQAMPEVARLRAELAIQKTAKEMKLKHLAEGDFEDVLASEKIAIFLNWLSANKICIHFSNINILYWGLVDIVDTVMFKKGLMSYISMHKAMKNELYRLVNCETFEFLRLLKAHGFPAIEGGSGGAFLGEVERFLDRHIGEEPNVPTSMLMALLRDGKALEEVSFNGQTQGVIIAGFDKFFVQPICNLKNSRHIFDREVEVERALRAYRLMDGEREVDFRFSDSKEEVGIQLSDIVVGILGKYFVFIEDHSMAELTVKKAALTTTQKTNLTLIRELIDASDDACPAFCHRVATLDSEWKAAAFLFDRPAPSHLL